MKGRAPDIDICSGAKDSLQRKSTLLSAPVFKLERLRRFLLGGEAVRLIRRRRHVAGRRRCQAAARRLAGKRRELALVLILEQATEQAALIAKLARGHPVATIL